jgi:hypothetical protein
MRVRRLFRYFQRPFPAATGFSPYRFPGLAAHLPILGAFLVLGWSLCGGHGYFWPLLVIYFIAGLYLGRDWAIQAHYNPFILVGAWLGFLLLLHYLPRVARWAARPGVVPHGTVVGISGAVILFFGWHVSRTLDWFDDDARKRVTYGFE